MRKIRTFFSALMLSVCLFCFGTSRNKESFAEKQHFRLLYVVDVAELDSAYSDNSERMIDIKEFLTESARDTSIRFTGVEFKGTASPEGPYERNLWLAENRLRSFKDLVYTYGNIPDSLVKANSTEITWDEFREAIAESDMVYRDEVLAIIDRDEELVPFWGGRHIDNRLLELKSLHGGKVWESLQNPILHDLRYGDAVFYYTREMPQLRIMTIPVETVVEMPVTLQVPAIVEYETWTPRWYLKTNFAAWVLFSANLAFEIDMGRHWSFTLPVYYCGMDWFKSTIKFRNFTIQPEIRWWPRSTENEGFFLGAHFMMSYYNIALNGDWRYQDYRGRTPALGGGIALGYRTPISKNRRWHMEFSVGAGIYPLDYSLFHNTPDYKDGEWHARNKKTYIGIDQVGITLAYSFDMNRYKRTYLKKGTDL